MSRDDPSFLNLGYTVSEPASGANQEWDLALSDLPRPMQRLLFRLSVEPGPHSELGGSMEPMDVQSPELWRPGNMLNPLDSRSCLGSQEIALGPAVTRDPGESRAFPESSSRRHIIQHGGSGSERGRAVGVSGHVMVAEAHGTLPGGLGGAQAGDGGKSTTRSSSRRCRATSARRISRV